jgi:RecB family exonuclease
MRRLTRSERPLRQPDQPVAVSASMLQALLDCPAKWFLEREAGGERVTTSSQGFGTVVHAIADRLANGDLTPEDDLMALVDEVWDQMDFRTPWSRGREREAVEAALHRYVEWEAAGGRTLLGTEARVDVETTLPDGQVVRLHGYADRLELDADGKVWVVDLKTGKYHPTDKSVADNSQLGLYQLAVASGAVDEAVGRPAEPGGAELVHLRIGGDLPKVQAQPPQPEVDGATTVQRQLMQVARAVREEDLVARPEQTLCSRCAFVPICPAHAAGSVLS